MATRSPTSPGIAITPDPAHDGDTLQCTLVTPSEDPDGDAITYDYRWSQNGTAAGFDNTDVDPGGTEVGDTWQCQMTAGDGIVTSASSEATVLIAEDCTGDGRTVVGTMSFNEVCGSTFLMGCTDGQTDCGDDETEHPVTLTGAFWVSQTEVTQAQFEDRMSYSPAAFVDCGSDCPVEQVTWDEAAAFANALSAAEGFDACYTCAGGGSAVQCEPTGDPYGCEGFRLPTEAEWESAARCGEDLLYAGSDDVNEVAWYQDNSGSTPHPVGRLTPNACGLYDMTGNVWEWAEDWYTEDYGEAHVTDPTGAISGSFRVMRGGGWYTAPASGRVSDRNGVQEGEVSSRHGFRVVRGG